MKLIVTIDVEEDSGPGWVCPPKSSFLGVTHGLKNRLQPLFHDLGIRPTLLISGIVLQDIASVDVLAQLDQVELGAHLHWGQIAPHPERTLQGGPGRLPHMQHDYPPEAEREKLEVLTELFHQQFGFRPTSFRAGRYGASRATGALLKQLGYEVDSSATPHIKWPTPAGAFIDYSQAPEHPYYIAAPGDIYRQGDFDLLEVPITILDKSEIPGLAEAPWFRPAYSKLETLKEIVRTVRERNSAGVEQPLVMMFHNVEVIPNASPYTKTEDDVRAYLDDLRGALAYAVDMGFEPCTLTEYARGFKQETERARQTQQAYQSRLAQDRQAADNGIGIPFDEIRRVVDRHHVPSWHPYIYKDRNARWDVLAVSEWVATNLPNDAAILSAGCGMGFNLYWWARRGFTDLNGFDCDEKTIAASQELIERFKLPIRLWVDRLENAEHCFDRRFNYIEAMNCLMLGNDLYPRFLKAYAKALKPGGYLALDVIDESYNRVPNNQWRTNDWGKPVAERGASQYKTRLSEKQIVDMAAQNGLALVAAIRDPKDELCRIVYIFRKSLIRTAADLDPPKEKPMSNETKTGAPPVTPRLPRVLFCVDAPMWAHDFKSMNIIKHLSPQFDFRKRFPGTVAREDFEWADVIIVFYWMQLPDLTPFIPLFRDKTALGGICGAVELEGERRAPGLKALTVLFDAVFVHNRLLYDEFKNYFSAKPFYLTPNGVDTTFYTPAAAPHTGKPLVVGWAGSLNNNGATLRGYHDIIIPAVQQTPGVELRTAAREDKWRGPDEMLEFYRGLDLYLVASRSEGTPNPALEAAACGVPVIATPVGNMPELIRHGSNGFLIDRTPESLSLRLMQLRDDPALLQDMKKRIREDILAWDWSIQAQAYGRMIAESLARKGWNPDR